MESVRSSIVELSICDAWWYFILGLCSLAEFELCFLQGFWYHLGSLYANFYAYYNKSAFLRFSLYGCLGNKDVCKTTSLLVVKDLFFWWISFCIDSLLFYPLCFWLDIGSAFNSWFCLLLLFTLKVMCPSFYCTYDTENNNETCFSCIVLVTNISIFLQDFGTVLVITDKIVSIWCLANLLFWLFSFPSLVANKGFFFHLHKFLSYIAFDFPIFKIGCAGLHLI